MVVVLVLRIEDVVHGDEAVVFVDESRPGAAKLLHVPSYAQEETQVHAQRSNVRTSLAAYPKDAQVALVIVLDQVALVDRADAQLALDGRDKGWALKEGTGQRFDGSR